MSALDRLAVPANPLRLLGSRAPWAAMAYLVPYWIVGGLLFALGVGAVLFAAVGMVTFVGPPLALGAAAAVRGAAAFERVRARVVGARLDGPPRDDDAPRIAARARRRWTDNATWRALGYLVGLFVPLLLLDVVAAAVWLGLLALTVSPAWFWAVPQTFGSAPHERSVHGLVLGYLPDGPDGTRGLGVFVGTVPAALVLLAVAGVLFVAWTYVLVGAARLHRHAARVLLGPRIDPLAEVRATLERARARSTNPV